MFSCGPSNPEQEISAGTATDEKKANTSVEHAESYNQDLSYESEGATIFNLTDTLKADFNGLGKLDYAVFIKEIETSGIVITHGESNEKTKIGFGKPFAHLPQFNWVDYWGIVNDSITYEIVIEDAEIIGDREVKLDNTSIVVRKEELGGGLITFKEGEYIWIHQAD